MAQRPGVVGPEGLTPQPDRLVRDGDPAFGEQILDVAEAQAKAVVEPDCVTDDLGRKAVAAVAWRSALKPSGSARPIAHIFRATGITAYLRNGGTLERAQAIAAHESSRTTKLYDRTADAVTVEDIEKIGI